jgi:hypothetical protein
MSICNLTNAIKEPLSSTSHTSIICLTAKINHPSPNRPNKPSEILRMELRLQINEQKPKNDFVCTFIDFLMEIERLIKRKLRDSTALIE